MSAAATTRLATYGTLAPGRANHHHLAGIDGRRLRGIARGGLIHGGWGAALGFPGLVYDPRGDAIDVDLFEAPSLADHWDRLDAFEGDEYRRASVPVLTDRGSLEASVYVLAKEPQRTGPPPVPASAPDQER